MSLILPPVGTSRLLELVSPYGPDDGIARGLPAPLYRRAAARLECGATVAYAFVGGVDDHAFAQSACDATA